MRCCFQCRPGRWGFRWLIPVIVLAQAPSARACWGAFPPGALPACRSCFSNQLPVSPLAPRR
eukprot:4862972-Prorocentrum_lima.AAC.1